MKSLFKVLVVVMAIGSLAQAVALAKAKTENGSKTFSAKGGTGPGI
ncbi:MAG: hypothetical protein Q7U04_04420 [Bacteriovorax sp.]|nr:hypothetical protein [Bacteriovorax sp.]